MRTDRNKRPNFLVRLGQWLVQPHPAVTDRPQARRVSLAATLAVLLFVTNIAGLLVQIGDTAPEARAQQIGLASLSGFILVSYLFIRSPYHRLGAFLLILAISSNPFQLVLSGGSRDPVKTLLFILPLGFVTAGALLNAWEMFLYLGLTVGAVALLPALGVRMDSADLGTMLGILTGLGLLLIFFNNFRARLEAERVAELNQTNEELRGLSTTLEQRVEARTQEINARSAQLESAAFITRQTAGIQDLDGLMGEVARMTADYFGFYHVGLFLVNQTGEYLTLQTASSEGGARLLARSYTLPIGFDNAISRAAQLRVAQITHSGSPDIPLASVPELPETRSEIALPLLARGRLIGVLDIQAAGEEAFSQPDIYALQGLADQVALSIENNRLLADSQQAIQQLQALTTETTFKNWAERLGKRTHYYRYTPTSLSSTSIDRSEAAPSGKTIEMPISLRGQKIGTLHLRRSGSMTEWSRREHELVEEIAVQIGLALENARLLEESQQRAMREQTINEISARLSRTIDVNALLQTAARELHQLGNVSEVSVYLGQADKGKA